MHEEIKVSFTMDRILPILDDIFTPGSTRFSDYLRWTCECHGDFYRTCHCKRNAPIKDTYDGYKKATHIIVAFSRSTPFSIDRIGYEPWMDMESSKLHLQLTPAVEAAIEDAIQWDIDLGYPHYRVIDLVTKVEVTKDYPPADFKYYDYSAADVQGLKEEFIRMFGK